MPQDYIVMPMIYIYIHNDSVTIATFYSIDQVLLKYSNPSLSYSQRTRRSRRSVGNKTMELMLYLDTGLIASRGGDVAATNYALSIMNIVS